MKASVYVATSVDGFIARANRDLDWLPTDSGPSQGEDYGYGVFMETVDAIVMGRNTYDKVLTFGSWPYKDTPVFVLSSRTLDRPDFVPASVERMSYSPGEVVARLAARGAEHLYVDGGRTIQRFLDAGLIQRLIITRVPILLGDGIPLFGPLRSDIRLRHVASRAYPTGLVQDEYEVAA